MTQQTTRQDASRRGAARHGTARRGDTSQPGSQSGRHRSVRTCCWPALPGSEVPAWLHAHAPAPQRPSAPAPTPTPPPTQPRMRKDTSCVSREQVTAPRSTAQHRSSDQQTSLTGRSNPQLQQPTPPLHTPCRHLQRYRQAPAHPPNTCTPSRHLHIPSRHLHDLQISLTPHV